MCIRDRRRTETCSQSIQRQYSADLPRTGILSGRSDRSLELRRLDNGSALIEILYSLEKLNFFKGAEGLGEQRGQHICFANASHKWLSASLAVWDSPTGIRSRNSLLTRKSQSFKAFSRWNFGFILLSTRQSLEWNETLTTGCRLFRHPEAPFQFLGKGFLLYRKPFTYFFSEFP